jgi:hypothetical protein
MRAWTRRAGTLADNQGVGGVGQDGFGVVGRHARWAVPSSASASSPLVVQHKCQRRHRVSCSTSSAISSAMSR